MQSSCNSGHNLQNCFSSANAHPRILLTLPRFLFWEMSTGIGSNSSPLPLSPHDMRKVESGDKGKMADGTSKRKIKGNARRLKMSRGNGNYSTLGDCSLTNWICYEAVSGIYMFKRSRMALIIWHFQGLTRKLLSRCQLFQK